MHFVTSHSHQICLVGACLSIFQCLQAIRYNIKSADCGVSICTFIFSHIYCRYSLFSEVPDIPVCERTCNKLRSVLGNPCICWQWFSQDWKMITCIKHMIWTSKGDVFSLIIMTANVILIYNSSNKKLI